jgi:predicted nuclease of predicted toxin-antitoxin system
MKSKKRSAANSKKSPPKPVFFLDRSLGKHIVADALRHAGAEVRIHGDHFAEDEKDERWLREVGKQGWIVLTKDKNIRYHLLEIAALIRGAVSAFILTSGNLTGSEMATAFVKALPQMNRLAEKIPRPFVATVTKSGSVSVLYHSSQLHHRGNK